MRNAAALFPVGDGGLLHPQGVCCRDLGAEMFNDLLYFHDVKLWVDVVSV